MLDRLCFEFRVYGLCSIGLYKFCRVAADVSRIFKLIWVLEGDFDAVVV